MKKLFSILLTAAMLLASLTAAHCEDNIKVVLDGTAIEFDVPPQIINDRTMVPMRAIFEALGAQVDWNGETQTITANSKAERPNMTANMTITMQAGNNTMTKEIWDMKFYSEVHPDVYSEEIPIELDVAPMIIDSRTLVPVRAVSESFDCGVEWDNETRTVTITSPQTEEETKPAAKPVSAFPITYDNTNERQAHYMRDFQILECDKDADGNYVIKYKLQTFLEGRGTVSVSFDCFDENGRVVDSFGGMHMGTDYTWSLFEDTAVISGKTTKISLVLSKE